MRVVGWILAVVGVLFAVLGIGMGAAPPGSQYINLGMMGERTACLQLGTMLFLGGIVLIAAGQLRAALLDPLERAARHLDALDTRARSAAGEPVVGSRRS